MLYVVGQAIEDGSYEGNAMRAIATLDTSCSRQFRALIRDFAVEESFRTLEREWDELEGHAFLLEMQKMELRIKLTKFGSKFKVRLTRRSISTNMSQTRPLACDRDELFI